jgi:hypothetical protein
MNYNDVKAFEDVQDSYNNHIAQHILQHLKNWNICSDQKEEHTDYSDYGMLYRSLDIKPDETVVENEYLNVFAYQILYKITTILQINDWEPVRYLWNYYSKASTCHEHVDDSRYPDHDKFNYYSIVYYINTCDGGTTVNGVFYPSIERTCIMFPSNVLHQGKGPTESSRRFVLNIMFRTPK